MTGCAPWTTRYGNAAPEFRETVQGGTRCDETLRTLSAQHRSIRARTGCSANQDGSRVARVHGRDGQRRGLVRGHSAAAADAAGGPADAAGGPADAAGGPA